MGTPHGDNYDDWIKLDKRIGIKITHPEVAIVDGQLLVDGKPYDPCSEPHPASSPCDDGDAAGD